MPDDDISQLSDAGLVDAVHAARDDRAVHQIEAEMWRRTTATAEHANLIAEERALSTETVGLWAIEVAILAILITLFVVPNSFVDPGGFTVGIVVSAAALLVNTVALLTALNRRARARQKLRVFDAERQAGT